MVKTHGVREFDTANSEEHFHKECIKRNGYTLITDVLNDDELKYCRKALVDIYNNQIDEFGYENFKIINDMNIVRSMLVYDDFFLEKVAIHPRLIGLIKSILGVNISLSSQVGILNQPRDELYQTGWHRELQYQHFTSSRQSVCKAIGL